MLIPTKIIKPVDSLFGISAFILKALDIREMDIDELLDEVNNIYYKRINLEKLILCLNFLYIINKIELDNGIVKIII